jgi:DNA-binding NtrC family response regulator
MKRVLLVEDEIMTRKSIAKNLRELGYDVKEAGSLKEARELIADNIFDILITDTSFGEVSDESGVEVAKIFREQFPDGKVIAMSNYSRTCWDHRNSNLYVDKMALEHIKSLAKILTSVIWWNN